jgi:hypothetical protein
MPGMDGIEVGELFEERKASRNPPLRRFRWHAEMVLF